MSEENTRQAYVMLTAYHVNRFKVCGHCGKMTHNRVDLWVDPARLMQLMKSGIDQSQAELTAMNEAIERQYSGKNNVPFDTLVCCGDLLQVVMSIYMGVSSASKSIIDAWSKQEGGVLYLFDRNLSDDTTYPSLTVWNKNDVSSFLHIYYHGRNTLTYIEDIES